MFDTHLEYYEAFEFRKSEIAESDICSGDIVNGRMAISIVKQDKILEGELYVSYLPYLVLSVISNSKLNEDIYIGNITHVMMGIPFTMLGIHVFKRRDILVG